MNWKKELLQKSRWYLILDPKFLLWPIDILKKMNNIDIIQLRDKYSDKKQVLSEAKRIKKLLNRNRQIFIINDYIDIAQLVGADGIHLGQNDLPIVLAKKLLGERKIIGISCHSIEEALEAEREGADYISIGPIFGTALKPNLKPLNIGILKEISKCIHIPFFPVGGIDLSNLNKILFLKIPRVSFCRLLCGAEEPFLVIERMKELWEKYLLS
ncbi:MAG: thiamine phosphate synthase [Candidatus Omnitrophica bacterium]|nr:thiamine phosphate synthase [Candidatus Omnitrophota bacterium]